MNDQGLVHTLAVLASLEALFQEDLPTGVQEYLDQIVETNTRHKLLYLATVFHDIGKPDTIITNPDGSTACPGHEEKGAEITEKILMRVNLSQQEREHIVTIIRNHGKLHSIPGKIGKDLDVALKAFADEHEGMYPELVLFTIADMSGSQLQQTIPEEYTRRVNICQNLLKAHASN